MEKPTSSDPTLVNAFTEYRKLSTVLALPPGEPTKQDLTTESMFLTSSLELLEFLDTSPNVIDRLKSLPVITTQDLDTAVRHYPWEKSASQFDRYDMEEQPFSKGGFGALYRAKDRITKEIVCIKKLLPSNINDLPSRQRFEREALLLMALDHPNIVKGHNVFIHNDEASKQNEIFLVMDYVDEQSLFTRIHDKGPLSPEQGMEVLKDVTEALTYLHDKGVINRDLKPENILTGKTTTLIDLGLCNAVFPYDPELIIGTEGYSTYLDGEDDVTKDILSEGVLIYFMHTKRQHDSKVLFKRPTFIQSQLTIKERTTFESVMLDLAGHFATKYINPKAIIPVIDKATFPEQKNRYSNSRELFEDYEKAVKSMKLKSNVLLNDSNTQGGSQDKPASTFIIDGLVLADSNDSIILPASSLSAD